MSKNPVSVYRDLAWLPARSDARPAFGAEDFVDRNALRRATASRLTEDDLRRLVKVRDQQGPLPYAAALNLTILSNANFELLAKTVRGAGLRLGLDLTIDVAPMGMVGTWALGAEVDTAPSSRDGGYVLLALTPQYFSLPDLVGDGAAADRFLDALFSELSLVRDAAQSRGWTLLAQSVPPPSMNLLGPVEVQVPGTPMNLIAAFNDRLRREGLSVVDIFDLSCRIGQANWSSDHYWHWAKLPFHPDNNVVYADRLCRSLHALRGGAAKCLVLDLDNTVWKGVIGDDGLEGIEIGNNSPAGEAHLSVQRLALSLMRCGIVLAVCSKNDFDVAVRPFKGHADMLLKYEDITVFVANWEDKATNLQSIAQTLDLGLDSFVFIDDNPMERDLVRRVLPEVRVPELPGEDPSQWIEIIGAAGYFDTYSFTETDKDRSAQYRANAARERVRLESRDLTTYLRELSMELIVAGFTEDVGSRVVQLIGRSNQFNLTTRRYSLDDVRRFRADPMVLDLSFRLKDKFGDNGIIAVLIGRLDGSDMLVDTWLMSCRVLKRGVEEACLTCLARAARAMGAQRLIGEYVPTAKNSMVAGLYARLGFKPLDDAAQDDKATRWALDLMDFVEPPSVMEIRMGG